MQNPVIKTFILIKIGSGSRKLQEIINKVR